MRGVDQATKREPSDTSVFQAYRAAVHGLAYRMLGDVAAAEDIVQDTWLRWHGRATDELIANPRSYLLTIAARLCLNVLDSAHGRREEPRTTLPEVTRSDTVGLEIMEQVSMAFLVLLQRLAPVERAVLVLHDVFDLSHREIASLLAKTESNTRQLLKRAKTAIATNRGVRVATREQHERLLRAFQAAARSGDVGALAALLADDATLVTDGGEVGVQVGPVRSLVRPLIGAVAIARFVVAATAASGNAEAREQLLNGQPALVVYRDARPLIAIFLAIADDQIIQVMVQGDPERLSQLS